MPLFSSLALGTASALAVTLISRLLDNKGGSQVIRKIFFSSLTAASAYLFYGATDVTTATATAAAVILLAPPRLASRIHALPMAVLAASYLAEGSSVFDDLGRSATAVMLLLLVPQLLFCGLRRPGLRAAGHAVDAGLWNLGRQTVSPSPQDFFVNTRSGRVRMRLIQPDGSSALVQSGPAALPADTEALVILVPDAPVFVEHAIPAAEAVAVALKLPVAVFDLPGFGLSRPTSAYDHSLTAATGVIEDVAASLKAPRLFLHGSCVTGLYCLAYAQASAARGSKASPCAGVVVGNTPCLDDLKRWTDHNVSIKALFVPVIGQILMRLSAHTIIDRWFSFSVPAATPDRPARLRAWSETSHHCLGKQGGCWCFAGVVQGVYFDDNKAVRAVPSSIPVTSLWGPGDRSHKKVATKPESLERMVPHAKTVVLPADAGHAPGLERPDLLIDALRDQVEVALRRQN